MKKALILLFLFVITLTGCQAQTDPSIEYLNGHECATYIFSSNKDNYGLNKIYNIANVDEIDKNEQFVGVIIDVQNCLELLTQNTIDGLYDLVEENRNVIVMFYDAENYDFFKNTKLANEKDYYNNVSEILYYDNLYGYVKEGHISTVPKSITNCFDLYVNFMKEYYGML